MNHFFITGTSRGIGKALAELLLEDPQNRVTGLARGCSISHERYTHVTVDLADLAQVRGWKFPAVENAERLVLVNNAGAIGEVSYSGRQDEEAVIRAYHVNLVTPTLLTNAFLKAYEGNAASQVILNVSSGAASSPIDGWSVYCATKAGLDHFTRTVHEELKISGKANVRVFSVAPGVVDTAMQSEIRSADPGNFSRLDHFQGLKSGGQLAAADLTARKYVSILVNPDEFPETIFSLRNLPPTQ
jgi:benzil reductase ((S)-benzoin forming)